MSAIPGTEAELQQQLVEEIAAAIRHTMKTSVNILGKPRSPTDGYQRGVADGIFAASEVLIPLHPALAEALKDGWILCSERIAEQIEELRASGR